MKFYTTSAYAQKYKIAESTVYEHSREKKLETYTISQSKETPRLICEPSNDTPYIVSLINLKGGCAKTTTAAHLAILLAKFHFRVLLIDSDHQNQCRLFFPNQNNKFSLVDIIEGAKIQDCIHRIITNSFEMDMLFSGFALPMVSNQIKTTEWMTDVIQPVRSNYDFIIIDTAPAFTILEHNIAIVSTNIVIPLTPTTAHVDGLDHYIKGLKKILKIPSERITGILPTIVEPQLAQQKYYLKELKNIYGDILFDSKILKDAHLPKTMDFGTNIFDYREKCKSSQALKKFVWELLQRL